VHGKGPKESGELLAVNHSHVIAFPGRGAARSEAEWCTADPGPSHTPSLLRSRISGAPLSRCTASGKRQWKGHSAGFDAAAAAAAARSAASRFSTMRTDQIEPSNSATSGSASDIWLSTSGGVSTAAMTKAPTMK
jgi:hypothetical protein